MRPLVRLTSILCMLAACSGELDAGVDPASSSTNVNGAGAGGTSGQAGSDSAAGAGTSGAAGQAGDGGTSAAGGDAGNGGTSAPGGGGAGNGGTTGATKVAVVQFGVRTYELVGDDHTPFYQNSPSLRFDSPPPPDLPPGCTDTSYGECVLRTCLGEGNLPYENYDAGVLTFSGGKLSPLAFSPLPKGSYGTLVPLPTTSGIADGGELITVSGGGADVPAFTVSAKVPLSPRIDGLPVMTPDGIPMTLDTTQDLGLVILDDTDGHLASIMYGSSGNSGSDEYSISALYCYTPAASPSQVFPAAALAALKARVESVMYETFLVSTTRVKAGDWDIAFSTVNIPRDKNGAMTPTRVRIDLQ